MFAYFVKIRAGAVFIASVFCLLSVALSGQVQAQEDTSKPVLASALDTATLDEWMARKPYPALIPLFEDLLQKHRPLHRVDSVFLLRGLARMTLANPETRDQGKAYLARVAKMNPGEPVWELYADQLEQDYAQVKQAARMTSTATPTSNPAQENVNASTLSWYEGKGLWWVAGGFGVGLIVGAITYVIMQDSQSSESQEHVFAVSANSHIK